MMHWTMLHPRATLDMLGLLPEFLSDRDPASAVAQLDASYQHGGGWRPFEGFRLNHATLELLYPGDPPTVPLAMTQLRDERIVIYQHAWVAVIQADGSFVVARMD